MTAAAPPANVPLGIIAGSGALPGLIAESCRARGETYFILALKGFADPSLMHGASGAWITMGEAARGFDLLKDAQVKRVVMIGGVKRPAFGDMVPDWRTAAFLARVVIHALGDDGLLRAVIAEIEREGLRVVGIPDVAPDLLAPVGSLTRAPPGASWDQDVAIGLEAALDLGRADIGQAVVVANRAVIAREDRQGTDAMIARVAASGRGRGAVLVKCKKPEQDPRADLPAIGPATVKACADAGFSGIAVEAGATILIDRAEIIAAADAASLFVTGVRTPAVGAT
ncbi:MAG: UDP-2,3-diacylglucosamine diphosphatase LpxI [Rhodobacteraceae bacterium]|nr:UDP-2,3-diacylglucosamine diphosphatase LpxI [Paracoccaceae bacterium]